MKMLPLKIPLELRLDTERAERIRELTQFDVYTLPGNVEGFSRLVSEPKVFLDVLWEMIDQRAVTRQGFETWIRETDQDELWQAFAEEIGDFFRDQTTKEIIVQLVVETRSRWQTMLLKMQRNVSESSQSEPDEPSGSSPESSAFTPDDSRSDNSMTWPLDDSVLTGVVVAQ